MMMRRLSMILLAGVVVAAVSSEASATNYSLWIHGRSPSFTTAKGNYTSWPYWGSSATAGGVNKKAVNWGGEDATSISGNNAYITRALDCYCTGANWCYIAVHSAGDLALGYALANSGGSTRSVRNASPASDGTCGTTGATQVGWNIKWVDIGGGAGGGSDLADAAIWSSSPLVNNLKTTAARALYDHNQTRSKILYMFAAAKGTAYSGILPGQDDEVIAYHSSGGVASWGSFCNPGDLFCDGTLTTGSGATSNGKAKWTNHTVDFRDDGEAYNHFTNGTWSGIMSVVRLDMVAYAL